MNRDIIKYLIKWQKSLDYRPILIRDARQVGKTYTVRNFGKKYFDNFVEINFELAPELKTAFVSLNPSEIIEKISVFTGENILSKKTLLFLDEVQECPKAIMALRYFYELNPELHVIAAGSLVEFVIESESFRMPVGRVEFLYMFPLSFGEFLEALGEKN